MTPRETVVAELRRHFANKEFTVKDVAARVPFTMNWVYKVIVSTLGVTVSRTEPFLVRGVACTHMRPTFYYTFNPEEYASTTTSPTQREVTEKLIRRRFKGKTFTVAQVAEQIGISGVYARKIIHSMRGIKRAGSEKKDKPGSSKYLYTFKPVSTDRWVA